MDNLIKANLELVQRWIDAVNDHNLEKIAGTMHEDYEYDLGTAKISGRQQAMDAWKLYLEGLPDLHYDAVLMIGSNDDVAVRFRMSGTHKGPFRFAGVHSLQNPLLPTNKPIDIPTAAFFRIKDGKIINLWSYWDTALFMTQIGK